jgi:hypothetical protein
MTSYHYWYNIGTSRLIRSSLSRIGRAFAKSLTGMHIGERETKNTLFDGLVERSGFRLGRRFDGHFFTTVATHGSHAVNWNTE